MRRASPIDRCRDRLPTSHLSRPGDMTLPDFVKLYSPPPNVPVDLFCELAGIGSTKFYELVREGAIRVRKNGRFTTAPVEDLYHYIRGQQAAA